MSVPESLSDIDDRDIERRFLDVGVAVPRERASGAYAAARRLLEATHWLRNPRAAAAEPAHVFRLAADEETRS